MTDSKDNTSTDHSKTDMTVLRSDTSVSNSSVSRTPSTTETPRVLKQRFVLEEQLGCGGMGTVYRAKDLRKVEAGDRQPFLAIKVLNNDFRDHPEAFVALQREATKSQAVQHSNIVSIFDYDKDGDLPFITMELLEGQELAELLRAYPYGMPDEMAWPVIKGLCAGLGHAHESGIVHADFKPGNVFVSSSSSAKILDFGIARAVQLTETVGEDTLFDPGRLAALTPAYASREMINGESPEPRDDIYSLGVVIYFVLTGRHPFDRTSAEDAALQQLQPEKPRRLSMRQWRGVRKCLAFNREDRPANVEEVTEYLFAPSAWRSRSLLASTLAFVLALGVSLTFDRVVEQEVRRNTLIDAQISRISSLLEEPSFDRSWELAIERELELLRRLDQSQTVVIALEERIRDTYTSRIELTENAGEALNLLDRGSRFGELPEATDVAANLAFDGIEELLGEQRPTFAWYTQVAAELQRLRQTVPGHPHLAELDLQLADGLKRAVLGYLDRDEPEQAARMLAELRRLASDYASLGELQMLVEMARERITAAELVQLHHERNTQLGRDLEISLDVSCLRLDLPMLAAIHSRLESTRSADNGLATIDAKLIDCVTKLAELDPDRATTLQAQISRYFGDSVQAAHVRVVDPCGLSYLVGNGGTGGRGGYCADKIDAATIGPRLVVVPEVDGEGRYAITKHEVTWAHFSEFCGRYSNCALEGENGQLPVTGVSIGMAQAYARWLSRVTGFTYRLPTAEEWAWAAQGAPDPNRNCRVQLDGVQRGIAPVIATRGQGNKFGLLHMLGNVQEWVVDPDGIRAVGGAFADPISACVVQTSRHHAGDADRSTGFRLVREIS